MLLRWVACATDENHRNRLGPPLVYQDLRMRHDWLSKKAIVDLPIRMKGNLTRTSGNSLCPLGTSFANLTNGG